MWLYKEQVIENIEQFPEGTFGFIYKITRKKDGKFYIGRKNLYSERSKPLTKKELLEHTGKGKKPTKKKVVTESDWKRYFGSEPSLKEDIKQLGEDAFKREILHFTNNKLETSYYEEHYQHVLNVLNSNTYNSNIAGKYYKAKLFAQVLNN